MSEDNKIRCNVSGTVIDLIRELSVSFHDNTGEYYTYIPKVINTKYLTREIEIKMSFGAIGTSDNHNWQSLSVNQVKFGKGYLSVSFKVNYNGEIEPNIYGAFESDGMFFDASARSVKDLIDQFLGCIDEIKDFSKKIDNYVDQIPTKNVIVGIPEEDK